MVRSKSPQELIPASFPRPLHLASLAGRQPKISVRKVDGAYVQGGPTDEEVAERYGICLDLVQQLIPYCARKRKEHPEWTEAELTLKLAASIKAKGWDFTSDEIEWVVARAVEPQEQSFGEKPRAGDVKGGKSP